jgi:hypothetical protein
MKSNEIRLRRTRINVNSAPTVVASAASRGRGRQALAGRQYDVRSRQNATASSRMSGSDDVTAVMNR